MPKKQHPLEGKYVVYKYISCDSEGEGESLSVSRLKNGKLVDIFEPALIGPSCLEDRMYDEIAKEYVSGSEYAVRKLKGLSVTEVYAVSGEKPFLGMRLGIFSSDDTEDDENWSELQEVSPHSDEHELLKGNGIDVKFFDNDLEKIIER